MWRSEKSARSYCVVIMVGEWIPFGCNQILQLTSKLGVNDRVKGGYFTDTIDKEPTKTVLELPVGLTKVWRLVVMYDG